MDLAINIYQYLSRGFWEIFQAIPLGIVIAVAVCLLNHKKLTKYKAFLITITSIYFAGILKIVGLPNQNPVSFDRFMESVKGLMVPLTDSNISMLLLNFMLFIPFGVLLCLLFQGHNKYKKVVITCAAFSVMIEVIQGFTGRLLESDDLIMNTAGGAVGMLAYIVLLKLKITWPKKTEILTLICSALMFTGMTFTSALFQETDTTSKSTDCYFTLRDSYDSSSSNIFDLYDQEDSLERLVNCCEASESYFGDRLEELTVQTISHNDEPIDILFAGETFYKKYNLDTYITEGSGIKDFNYNEDEMPILLPESYKDKYSLNKTFHASILGGKTTVNCRICGYLNEDSFLSLHDDTIDFMITGIAPLYSCKDLMASNFSELDKKIFVTERLEGSIAYHSEGQYAKDLNFIQKASKKYDLDLITIANPSNYPADGKIPKSISITILILGFLFFCLFLYKCIIWSDKSGKVGFVNFLFWNIIISYIFIMLISGFYPYGYKFESTAICFSLQAVIYLFMKQKIKEPRCAAK